ncbi:Two component system, signal transduction response regulator [Acididesulfobacillus acetoxydans]|uniref:Stage 0 sporulation protein A homolog n=1 Tax=Acididesulfobacillus acetoxydans TaxID=1561005 RepID=A0A8S0XVE5_9FIRM|nr:response regulator transcription factor [Acididesulfobacillus acetoxydans]CAA7600267.1 Two component system, signal transduction response regulator [Acididesulfobacillus acetoxydans]CEJ09645.1 Response regulator [Acididesulfobacillus acetoxydans]
MRSDQEKPDKTKILLVDDHTLFAEGTADLLSAETALEVVGIAHDGRECLAFLKSETPDVIMLDIALPDCLGIGLIDRIKARQPSVKIIMLTGLNPGDYLREALRKGVHGFLTKECNKRELIEAIFSVKHGQDYFSKGVVPFLRPACSGYGEQARTSAAQSDGVAKLLSDREEEVMDLMARGLSDREISSALGITIRTVKYHTGNIRSKLGVKSRSKAIAVWSNGGNRAYEGMDIQP